MAPNITTTTTTVTIKPVSMPSKAYVTFLAGNGDYVKGVVGLAKGLRKVKTKYPLVVAILPDVPEDHREILVSQGCIVREIEPVYPPENQTQFAMAYYVINYSKLRIWEAYVTFLAGNGDYVKGVVGLAKGLRKVKTKYPLVVAILPDVPEDHREILVSQGCIVREIEPVYPPENQTQFAMAYYVINYSKLRIWEFVEYSKMIYLDGDIQDFLNMFFNDIYKPISSVYNLVLAMLWRHPENIEFDKVKVVHYCAAGSKPWSN
ncbi:galactinol synthase 2 [Quercus suber]|uniref:Hexosyltransferase n=1 Tax=Quercus suber TaxID=58331 RepID=A0AAW0IL89_QUESU